MVVFSQHKGNIVNIFVTQKISFFKKAAEGKPWPLPFNHLAHGCPVSRRSLQRICHIFAFFGRDFRPSYQNIVMRFSFNAKQIKMWRQREFATAFPLELPLFLRCAYFTSFATQLCSCFRNNNPFATAHLCRRSFLRRERADSTFPFFAFRFLRASEFRFSLVISSEPLIPFSYFLCTVKDSSIVRF